MRGWNCSRPNTRSTTGPSLSRDDFLASLPDYDALVVRSGVKVDAEAIAAGTRLRVIGRAGVGVDNIDVDAATAAGIVVVNAPTANTIAAAELTVGLIYALARHVPAGRGIAPPRRVAQGGFRRHGAARQNSWHRRPGQDRHGRRSARPSHGDDAARQRPVRQRGSAAAQGIELVGMDELLRRADVVTVHVPLNAATRGLIEPEQLAVDEADRVR